MLLEGDDFQLKMEFLEGSQPKMFTRCHYNSRVLSFEVGAFITSPETHWYAMSIYS